MSGGTVSARPAALQAHRAALAEPRARLAARLAVLRSQLDLLTVEERSFGAGGHGATEACASLAALLDRIGTTDRWVGEVGDAFARLTPGGAAVVEVRAAQVIAAVPPPATPERARRHVAALVAAHHRIDGSAARAAVWLDELEALAVHDPAVARVVLETIGGAAFVGIVPVVARLRRDEGDVDLAVSDAARVLAAASRAGLSAGFVTSLTARAATHTPLRRDLALLLVEGRFDDGFLAEVSIAVLDGETEHRLALEINRRWAVPPDPPPPVGSRVQDPITLVAHALVRQPGAAATVLGSPLTIGPNQRRAREEGVLDRPLRTMADLFTSTIPTADRGAATGAALLAALGQLQASGRQAQADQVSAAVVDRLLRGVGEQHELLPPLVAVLVTFHLDALVDQLTSVNRAGRGYLGGDERLGGVVDGRLDVTLAQAQLLLARGWGDARTAGQLSDALVANVSDRVLAGFAAGTALGTSAGGQPDASLRTLAAIHRELSAFLQGRVVTGQRSDDLAKDRAYFALDFVLGKFGVPIGLGDLDKLTKSVNGKDERELLAVGDRGVVDVSHSLLALAVLAGAVAPSALPEAVRDGNRLVNRVDLARDERRAKAFEDWLARPEGMIADGVPPEVVDALGRLRADVVPDPRAYARHMER